jgi:hypothetical protein
MLKMGINKNISNKDYHADRKFLSSSALKLILKDKRAFFKKYILNEPEYNTSNPNFNFGSYVHSIILEPEQTEADFAVFNGRKAGKVWESFKETVGDKIVISSSQEGLAKDMLAAYYEAPLSSNLTAVGDAEVTLCTTLDDMNVKVRADFLNSDNAIIDLKTTSYPLTRESILETIEKYDYDLSCALYMDAFETKDMYLTFLNKNTNDIVSFKVSEETYQKGRDKYKKAIQIWKDNIQNNTWETTTIEEI